MTAIDEQAQTQSQREMIAALHASFVALYLELLNERGERFAQYFSAFLLSLQGQWLIVTAGHCVQVIEHLLSQGYRFKRQYVVDKAGSQMGAPFTFSWEEMRPWSLDRDGMDYGVLFVDPFSKRNLQASHRLAVEEAIWAHPLPRIDAPNLHYWLVGVPEVDTITKVDFGRMVTMVFMIGRLAERPDEFWEEPAVETLWGDIGGTDSIVGTSGGAVYAVHDLPDISTFRPVAVQSRWSKDTRRIRAPSVQPLVHLLVDSGVLGERRHPN